MCETASNISTDRTNFNIFASSLVSVPHNLRNHNSTLLIHLDYIVREIIKDFEKNVIFYHLSRMLRGKSKSILNYVNILQKIIFGQSIAGRWMTDMTAIVILCMYVNYEKYVLPDDIVRSFEKVYSQHIMDIYPQQQYSQPRNGQSCEYPGIMERYRISGRWNNKMKHSDLERDIIQNSNVVRAIRVIQEEWSDYPPNDRHVTLVTWLPNEIVEDILLLVGNRNLLTLATF